MIEGVVNAAYEPVVVLTVTPALATELELALEGTSRATLADGSEVTFDVYDVAVLWDG